MSEQQTQQKMSDQQIVENAKALGLDRAKVKETAEKLFDSEERLASFAFTMGYVECLSRISGAGAEGKFRSLDDVLIWVMKEILEAPNITLTPELRSKLLEHNNHRLASAFKHFGFTPTV